MAPSTTYRELVERWKGSLVDAAARLGPEDDPPPMWELIGRDPDNDTLIVTDDNRTAAAVIPDLIRAHDAVAVANIFFAWLTPVGGGRTERAIVMVLDAERVEMWHAPVVRSAGSPIIGPWECFGGSDPNEALGGIAETIQEALR